ncbi:MAG: LysR family transcriptional regulator [Mailhella sp.]|nr:LysR family transcriptional regulator [Mailhella sp.]
MQRDLEYSYAVYKTGSFSGAAKLLYASQPAVSMAVQRVEEDLGFAIFDRQAHPLKLTEAGKLFVRHVERLRESEDKLRGDLNHLSEAGGKRLRIGCTPMHALYLLPNVLPLLREKAPELDISVLNEFPKEMERHLRERKIDVAVNTMLEDAPLDYAYLPAFDVHYLLGVPREMAMSAGLADKGMCAEVVVSNRFLDRKFPSVPITAFSKIPFIDHSEGTEFFDQSERIFKESGMVPQKRITVSFPAMAHELARKGVGATIVGHFSVAENSPLLYYRLQTKWGKRNFFFVLRKNEELKEYHGLFIRMFLEHMKARYTGQA